MSNVLGVIAALFVLIIAAAIFITLGQYFPLTALTGIGYGFVGLVVVVIAVIVILFVFRR